MTHEERLDRETLLRRAAAAAGAVYLTPVLTSAAAAGSDGCLGFTCSKKTRKWKKKHRKKCQRSGTGCDCPAPGTPCIHGDPCGFCQHVGECCDLVEMCGGNCGCFLNGRGGNPGACIYLEDGLCQTFLDKHGACPSGSDSECSAGTRCFSSCCDCEHGFPPLCAECCNGRTEEATSRSRGGAGALYLAG